MIQVCRYQVSDKPDWDYFIPQSKNGTLLHYRDFMDYHAHRYTDHSLMVYEQGSLVALLPANLKDSTLYSHEGLTFGGLLTRPQVKLQQVIAYFDGVVEYLNSAGINTMYYKSIPVYYHQVLAQEDEYALFLKGATLVRRDTSIVIDLSQPILKQERRRRGVKKALGYDLVIERSNDFKGFWNHVLVPNLNRRFQVDPVHTVEEILYLQKLFPNYIHLYGAFSKGDYVGGTVLFINGNTTHAQYIAANEEGRKLYALDLLFEELIHHKFEGMRYFSLGICNEKEGKYLNSGLTEWKQSFGGQVMLHNFYKLVIE